MERLLIRLLLSKLVLLTILGVIWLVSIVTSKPVTISPYNILLDSNRNEQIFQL